MNRFFSLFKSKQKRSRYVFIDQTLQNEYELNGYVVVPFLNSYQLEDLKSLYNELKTPFTNGFNATLYSSDPIYKSNVATGILKVIGNNYSKYLNSFRPFAANFLTKHNDDTSKLPLHQDFSFTDEASFDSLNLWIPLVDVDEINGAVTVIPGSHKWDKFIRASPNTLSPYENVVDDLEPLHKMIKMRAGHALIHSHKLLHFSDINRSDEVRVAVCVGVIPNNAPLFHYYLHSDSKLECFKIDDDFFFNFKVGDYPDGYPIVNRLNNYVVHKYSKKKIMRFLK